MKGVIVVSGASFSLYILFPLFGIALLIYSGHSSQAICEIFRQCHYTIIIPFYICDYKVWKMTMKGFIVW